MDDRSITTPERIVEPRTAAALLADWGFLARPDLPDRAGPAFLLVALRERPTLRHYDPEEIRYWTALDGRGQPRVVDRRVPLPFEEEFSWGRITIVDRLGVTNEYLGFGGRVRAEKVDGAAIVVFESPAPILRRGGHSQGWDRGAEVVAAFFGRFLLAVDVVRGFEAQAAGASPETIYAAFLIDAVKRYRQSEPLRRGDPELWSLLRGEELRVRQVRPTTWEAGERLLGATRRDLQPV
jgi:hypothetical protein